MCVVGEFCFFISFISVFFCVFSVTIMTVRRSWNDLAAYSLNVSRIPTKNFSQSGVRIYNCYFLNRMFGIGLFFSLFVPCVSPEILLLSDSTISDKQGNPKGYLIWFCLTSKEGPIFYLNGGFAFDRYLNRTFFLKEVFCSGSLTGNYCYYAKFHSIWMP